MVTPFLFRHSTYAVNALPPAPSGPVPPPVAGASELPPHAAVSSTAADATNRAAAFDLSLGTMPLFLEGVAPPKRSYLAVTWVPPRNWLGAPCAGDFRKGPGLRANSEVGPSIRRGPSATLPAHG